MNKSLDAIASYLDISKASAAYINRIGYIPGELSEYPAFLPPSDIVKLVSHITGMPHEDTLFLLQIHLGKIPIFLREEIHVKA